MLGEGIVSFGVAVVTESCTNREGVGEDRLAQRHALLDVQRRRRELDRPLGVAELDLDVVLRRGDPAELVDEVHVPRGAAELAVGGRLQPDLLLLAHDVADRLVLDPLQLLGVDAPRLEVLARLQQRGRSQQAADVVGAEGWRGSRGHARNLPLVRAAHTCAQTGVTRARWRRGSRARHGRRPGPTGSTRRPGGDAAERTRTSTGVSPRRPERRVYTNFTTAACGRAG